MILIRCAVLGDAMLRCDATLPLVTILPRNLVEANIASPPYARQQIRRSPSIQKDNDNGTAVGSLLISLEKIGGTDRPRARRI